MSGDQLYLALVMGAMASFSMVLLFTTLSDRDRLPRA